MSGGHWSYNDFVVSEALTAVANDPQVRGRFPELAYAFEQLANVLPPIIHCLDLDLSEDQPITNDHRFQLKALFALKAALQ